MDDAERAFRDALHRVDSVTIPVPSLEPAEVRRTPGLGIMMSRWLAAAAAVAVLAGLGVWGFAGRGQVAAIPAAPATAASASPRLTGTTWVAVQLFGKPTEAIPDLPFLEFRSDSTYQGGDPCNGMSGSYRLAGDELTVTLPGPMTERGCKVTQQQDFMKALESTRRVLLDGKYLQFLDQPGTVVAIFQSTEGLPYPDASALPTPSPAGPTGHLPTPVGTQTADGVQIRLSNASGLDFEDVEVNFYDNRVSYGTIAAGTASGYQRTERAYSYAFVQLTAAGKQYRLQPIDFVGETELAPGRYTYILDLDGTRISLRLVAEK